MATPLILRVEGLIERQGVGCREVESGFAGTCHTDWLLSPRSYTKCDRYEGLRVPPVVVLTRRMAGFGSLNEATRKGYCEAAPVCSQDRSFVVGSDRLAIATAIVADYARLLKGNQRLLAETAERNKMPVGLLQEILDGTGPNAIAVDAVFELDLPPARVDGALTDGASLCIGEACVPLGKTAAQAIAASARRLLAIEE